LTGVLELTKTFLVLGLKLPVVVVWTRGRYFQGMDLSKDLNHSLRSLLYRLNGNITTHQILVCHGVFEVGVMALLGKVHHGG
jgi:hypothetical protein